jgi:threonine/homoserine/homoserine lactone efflux protein
MTLTVVVYGVVACAAGAVSRWLEGSRMRATRMRWVSATSFVGLGVWAALPERR